MIDIMGCACAAEGTPAHRTRWRKRDDLSIGWVRMAEMDIPLARHVAAMLQEQVLGLAPLHGGDLSAVVRLQLASGASVVAKSGPFAGREARMLQALGDAGAAVPRIVAFDDRALVLGDLGPATGPTDKGWRSLAASLRSLACAEASGYGWPEDYAFGAVPIRNGRHDDWAAFWVEERLAADSHALPPDLARRLNALSPRIMDVLPRHPRPTLLHGDLWSGNVHFAADGAAYLIDPASYFGHAEVDLAMLSLFGTPPRVFWEAYGGLAQDWALRRHIYQLWPALVHVRLFGPSYRPLVERLLAAIEVAA